MLNKSGAYKLYSHCRLYILATTISDLIKTLDSTTVLMLPTSLLPPKLSPLSVLQMNIPPLFLIQVEVERLSAKDCPTGSMWNDRDCALLYKDLTLNMSKCTEEEYPSIQSFCRFLSNTVPCCFLELSTAINKSSLAACDLSSHGIPVQLWDSLKLWWRYRLSLSLTHTGLRICWSPPLYLKEMCILASYPSLCNYCHLSSVCMIYSQLNLAQKGPVQPVVCSESD